MRADLLRAATGRPVLATPVLREDETAAMSATGRTGATQRIPAGVGGPPPRRTSPAVIAGLSVLGVLAVVALASGLIYANSGDGEEQPTTVTLPNLVGSTVEEATFQLNGLGLGVVATAQDDPDCTLNDVIGQSPQPGEVEPATEVELTVCAGPGSVQVPSLEGFTRAAAEVSLTERNLKAEFVEVNSSAPKDQVVEVPAEGELVEPGTTVEVHVSLNNLRTVPNVVGRTVEDAIAALDDAGFDPRVIEGEEVDPADAGRVTSQSPNSGEQRVNSRIDIVVSQAREDEPPPSPTPTPTPTPSPSSPSPTPPDDGGEGGGSDTPGTGGAGGGVGSLLPTPRLSDLI